MNNITHTDSGVCISVASNRAGFCLFSRLGKISRPVSKIAQIHQFESECKSARICIFFNLFFSWTTSEFDKTNYRQHESQLETIGVVDPNRREESCLFDEGLSMLKRRDIQQYLK